MINKGQPVIIDFGDAISLDLINDHLLDVKDIMANSLNSKLDPFFNDDLQ